MDVNESAGIISTLFTNDVLGSALLVAIVLIILVMYIGIKYRQEPLLWAVVFVVPLMIILAEGGFIPRFIGGILILLCSFLIGVAIWRFFRA